MLNFYFQILTRWVGIGEEELAPLAVELNLGMTRGLEVYGGSHQDKKF
jgi:hypothetical protein